MKTAREIAYMREVAAERTYLQHEQGHAIRSLQQAFHDDIYIPMMTRLIADMRAKGLLPKEPI